MTNTTSKLYDQATDTVQHLVETVRDEMPDLADVKSAAGGMTHRAGDLLEDVADRAMAFLPGAAARAARTRRRRWMWGGAAVIGLALLFALKRRLRGRSIETSPAAGTSGPTHIAAADEIPARNAETA